MTRDEALAEVQKLFPGDHITVCLYEGLHTGFSKLNHYSISVYFTFPYGESMAYATSFKNWQECVDAIKESRTGG